MQNASRTRISKPSSKTTSNEDLQFFTIHEDVLYIVGESIAPAFGMWTDTPTHTLTPGVGKKSLIAGHSILPALRGMCEAAGPDSP